jgi:hypothetical protein
VHAVIKNMTTTAKLLIWATIAVPLVSTAPVLLCGVFACGGWLRRRLRRLRAAGL